MNNIIKSIRTSKGYSEHDVARRLNVNPKLISSWELGLDIPSLEQINVMCEMFDITVDDIFSKDKIEPCDITDISQNYKDIIYQVYNSFIQMNEKEEQNEYNRK